MLLIFGRHEVRAAALGAVLVALLIGLAGAQAARAAAISDSEELTRFGSLGEGAGQLTLARGVATDPVTGHVYVGDAADPRVSEFTPWGKFVKAFGWDVAPGPVNEQQEVRVKAAGGEFKLEFEGEATPALPFGAGGGEVEAALDGLGKIGAGGVSVEAVASVLDGSIPVVYVVSFNGASSEGTDVPQVEATSASPGMELLVRTRADGHSATAGLESCTAESDCKAGSRGAGAGQLNSDLEGLAVDGEGNVYVMDDRNQRVQKFDSAGRFVLMFGGEVDKTTKANLCVAASGDVCGVGVAGPGAGEFGGLPGKGLTYCPAGPLCPAGALFIADGSRFERFSLDGEFEAQAPVSGNLGKLAFDPLSEDLYATFEDKEGVHKLDAATAAEISPTREVNGAWAVAVDAAGDLFAPSSAEHLVREFDPAGKPLSPSSCCEGPLSSDATTRFEPQGLATNAVGDLYVSYSLQGFDSFVRLFGPPPVSFEAPPKVAPEISAQFASSVQRDGASVAALINPHFWSDTRYVVQYGTGKCSEGGCDKEAPASPGALLTAKVFGSPLRSADVFLEGLGAGTTYHYRFVATSGGGGPVFGEEASFTTFDPLPAKACPNDALRIGPGQRLPDCRAYEMVSPVDKNNGDIKVLSDATGFSTSVGQSALDGEKLTYSSYRAFGEPKGAPYINQYIASRDPERGWASEAIDPGQSSAGELSTNLENPYKAFSADLCESWLVVAAEPLLAPSATPGYHELYRRQGCGEESYEALVGVPPSVPDFRFAPELQGTSADGEAAIVRARLVEGPLRTYYASEGRLEPLCVLPNGAASGGNCSGGTSGENANFNGLHRKASVTHAISADGSRVYWTDSGPNSVPRGKIYMRENPGAPESGGKDGKGNCVREAGRACTVAVSETQTTKASRFLGASADGARALFEVDDEDPAPTVKNHNLYKFTLGAGSSLIAGKALGVAGASEDLARVYFVSEEAIAGTSGAVAGEANLYLDEEGAKTFIATLAREDDVTGKPSDTSPEPIYHAARATGDGSRLAFISTAPITGYDNTDLEREGEADSEIYLYEVGAGGPACVSCNPSGARPAGRRLTTTGNGGELATAAAIPGASTSLRAPRALSADGRRLFFNSYDALLPRDTNGAEDVYEWESALSRQACAELGAELYVASSRGCLSLISSGESPQDAEFLDADPSGDNVFFTTNASLAPQDPGLVDVYDARVLGGIPAPAGGPAECQGGACQAPVPAPNAQTPASSSYEGPENQKHKKKHHKKKHHKKKHQHKKKAPSAKAGGKR